MFGLLTLIGFKIGETVTGSLAGGQTLAFMVLSLSQVVQAFNMRSEHSLFKIGMFTNHKLNWAGAFVPCIGFVGIVYASIHCLWLNFASLGTISAGTGIDSCSFRCDGDFQGLRADSASTRPAF